MRVLIPLLLVTVGFAGCTDDDSFVPAEADPCLVQSADDYSCDFDPDGDPDEVAHVHDYWNNRDRMVVLDYDKEAQPTSQQGIVSCDGFPWYEVTPDDGFTVIQGTQFVEVTMTWGEESYDNHGPPELWIKTADKDEPEFVADITNGQTVIFEVTSNDQNDLPHSLISAWQFVWMSYPVVEGNNTAGANCYHWHRSDFHVDVEIVRGLEIPIFPAHPDQWDGGNITAIEVMNEESTANYAWGDSPEQSSSLGAEHAPWDPWLLNDEAIVPYDSQRMEISLNVEARAATMDVQLAYHGADTRERTFLEPIRTEGTTKYYEIDVSRVEADGPYALQSLWEFWMYNGGQTEDFSGTITLQATVFKD